MNNSNLIENQLRSWRPRPPADRVEQALFGPPNRQRGHTTASLQRLLEAPRQSGWAAALGTFAILVFTLLNIAESAGLARSSSFIVPAVVSNASYAASFAAVEHNCVTAPIFGWTNPGELTSSIRSLESFNTNRLLP